MPLSLLSAEGMAPGLCSSKGKRICRLLILPVLGFAL